MSLDNYISENSSKVAFLFISFVVVASGYVTQLLPCQTQKFFDHNILAKHLIGILICFLFIMLEGGWSFDMKTQDKAEVDWSNGNVMDTLVFGTGLYLAFLLSSKMKLGPNLLLYAILFSIYLINAQRLYWKNRDLITKEENEKALGLVKIASFSALTVFAYGIINYYLYQKSEHKNKFDIVKFFVGKNECASLKK